MLMTNKFREERERESERKRERPHYGRDYKVKEGRSWGSRSTQSIKSGRWEASVLKRGLIKLALSVEEKVTKIFYFLDMKRNYRVTNLFLCFLLFLLVFMKQCIGTMMPPVSGFGTGISLSNIKLIVNRNIVVVK